MDIRPEFADFVSRRTGLPPEQVAERARPFSMTEGSEAETRLADAFETSSEFTGMAMQTAAEPDPQGTHFQALYPMLSPPKLDHAARPAAMRDVWMALEQDAAEKLGYAVIEKHVDKGADGVFAVDLYRRPVLTGEFDPQGPVMTSQKGVLFVDTTPGEPGGVAYLHRLTPEYPHLSAAEKRVAAAEAAPDLAQVRPEVRAALDRIGTATSADAGRTMEWNGSPNALRFYQGKELATSLRVEFATNQFAPAIPGIFAVPDGGTVALNVTPTDEYGDRIELNGEERKYLLGQLGQANERLWLSTPTREKWEHGEALQGDDMGVHDTAQALRYGIDRISLLLTNGDLASYDRLVGATHDTGSWLARLRNGVPPERAFGGA